MTTANLGQAGVVQQPDAGQPGYIAEPPWLKGEAQQSPAANAGPENLGFYVNKDEKAAAEARVVEVVEKVTRQKEAEARAEEAKLERAKLGTGVSLPPPTDPAAIALEWAVPKNVASLKMEYLVDPFLPVKCVVGFFGRGSTAKSSFVATMAARISDDFSSLWISVEEPKDWITQRHLHAGGAIGTLAVFAHKAIKRDAQDRVIGSTFDIYRDLEGSIVQAKAGSLSHHNPPRPLRLVVLDTAVGLTTWGKGESANDDGSVKRLLAYLQALAEKYDLCIAIIGHSNKGKHDYFADTVAGSSAWTNSPRLSFVHASDRREEHAFVMRVAKTNLSSFFAVAYRTAPVLDLHQHDDGHKSVLCRVELGPVVWGADASMELFEEATKKPRDDDVGEGGGGDHRPNLVSRVVQVLVELASESDEAVTREMVERKFGRAIARREWTKVDEQLAMGEFVHKVAIETGPKNKVLYRKQT